MHQNNQRVYEVEGSKKAEVLKLLEQDPYASDSFSRIGYKVKDGGVIGEDKDKIYVYFSADENFLKKADEKLKHLTKRTPHEIENRIIKKIKEEEEQAENGLGSIFGE